MIKIFDATDKIFNTAGNITINPLKCIEVKRKSLNGWYIEVEIPIKYKEYIEKDKLCVVQTKSKLNPQAFRIGEEIDYTNKIIRFIANHVMYDVNDYILLDVRPTNLNGNNALNYINQRTDKTSPFSFYSNVENVNTAYFVRKNILQALATIEERWNGVFDADNWNISFLNKVGNDNGEVISYGKNLQSMKIYEDWSNVVTRIYPVGYDGITIPEKYIESETQYEKPYSKVINFETKIEHEEQTEENLIIELRENAQKYIEENQFPKVSYEITSDINQNLEIGDTIHVKHPLVNILTEVLEYEYNVILKKVRKIVFGNFSRDVKAKFDNIKNSITEVKQALSKQESTIKNQTDLINSLNKNGYVYIDDNEILLLDRLPKEQAENVWRFGLAGIGFSSNGYEGPFNIAITMDGQINADFITTGTLNVSRIEGLSNFISETEKSISEIEINQGNITTRVETVENKTILYDEKEGKEIEISDAAEEKVLDFELDGESWQETRSGKNKFDVEKLSIIATDKNVNIGSFVVKNQWAATLITNENITKDLKPNTIYNALADVTLTEEPSNIHETSNHMNLLLLYKPGSSINVLQCSNMAEKNNWKLNETKKIITTFTTPNDFVDYRILAYNYYGGPDIRGTGAFKFENMMIIEASETDETFEQYGVSPSPEFPSLIRSVADDGTVTIGNRSKNYLNVPSNYVLTGNEVINLNLSAGDYIINWEDIITDGTDTSMLMVFYYEDGTEYSRYISSTYPSKRLALNAIKNINKVRIYSQSGYNNSLNVTTTFVNLMISREGEDYEEYFGKDYTIETEPLRNLPNGAKDTLEADGIHRRVEKVILDGSDNEGWILQNIDKLRYPFRNRYSRC